MADIFLGYLPFPEDDLQDDVRNVALGRFMMAWSQIEVVCGRLMADIINLQFPIAQTIFDRVGTREQIGILRGLIEDVADTEQQQRLEALMRDVETMSEKRNKIAHAS